MIPKRFRAATKASRLFLLKNSEVVTSVPLKPVFEYQIHIIYYYTRLIDIHFLELQNYRPGFIWIKATHTMIVKKLSVVPASLTVPVNNWTYSALICCYKLYSPKHTIKQLKAGKSLGISLTVLLRGTITTWLTIILIKLRSKANSILTIHLQ